MKNQKTGWKCSKLIYKAGLYREMQLFCDSEKSKFKDIKEKEDKNIIEIGLLEQGSIKIN